MAETTKRFLLRPPPAKHQSSAVSACHAAVNPNKHFIIGAPSMEALTKSDLSARTVSSTTVNLSINPQKRARFRKRKMSVKSTSCRAQCRSNQARYRQRQREYVLKLESTVAKLRAEIPVLGIQCRRLHDGSEQCVWDVGLEYFRLFRYGVGDSFEQGSPDTCGIPRASEAQKQLMFLRSTMAPNVAFGSVTGVEVLMEHWRRLSEYHDNLHFHLTHMEKLSESIVTATAIMSVTVTKTTLERVFSHLLESDNVEDLSMAVNLLGHRLDYPCSVIFVWDEESSLVERVETDIDTASPLLKFLGSLEDTSRVIEGAELTPTSSIDVASGSTA
uniref:BZIP domain-containing protein n=1 Tax=Hyaloperonospora arabidopsidis (strain Emoy2) TaxID=559515 RepID=M4BSV9_HYAAE